MDDEDVAVGHSLHLLRHGVTEHPLDLARLASPDHDETGIVRLGYLDHSGRDLADRLDELGLDAQFA